MDRLAGRLVELARADMMHAGGPAGPIDLTAPIAADALDAVLSTLLQNAMTHAPGAAVRIEDSAEGPAVRLTVADDGPGISAAHRDRVFEPFFTTARDRGGTGLGLPIVRALLAGAGGSIALLDPARGTAFAITLGPKRG